MTDRNVVIVLMDTAKFSAVSEVRETMQTTLDTLATGGCEYTNAFTNAPWSLPSHASLFTGTYTSKHGTHAGHMRFDDHHETLPELFQRHGYETAAVSNNTWISEEFGFGRGFQTFQKTWQYLQSDVDLGRIARTEEGTDKLKTLGKKLFDGNPLVNTANAIYGQFFRRQYDDGAKQTNEWIQNWLAKRDDSSPFFLFVNYLEPHLEYRPPKEFAEQFLPSNLSYEEAQNVSQDAWGYITRAVEMSEQDFEILHALYLAEIAYLDHRIGELKECLEEHGEWQDTVFVVTGDHGENIGDHGLMDHQYCLYDTLLHVPLILHGGSFADRESNSDLTQLPDLGVTLLDEVDIDAPEFRKQSQGISFHPETDAEPRTRVFAEYLTPQPSMEALEKRVGELPENVNKYDRSLRAIRTKDWKLIRGSDGSTELYNIPEDDTETDDCSSDRQEKVTELEAELNEWLDSFEHADQAGDVEMREETKERLEDLGYLQ